MTYKYDLREIQKIAEKLDEKMDITSFSRMPNIYLDLQKFDLLNVPVDQTKIGQKITIKDVSSEGTSSYYYQSNNKFLYEWINAILDIYPMNIKGEITFLMKDDVIDKIFMLKVSNIKDLAKLINHYPHYITGYDYGIYNGDAKKNKIYPMNYFQILYNQFNFLQNEENYQTFKYANYDIVMSRISNHKDQMKNTVQREFFTRYTALHKDPEIEHTSQTRHIRPFRLYGFILNNKYNLITVKNCEKWYDESSNSNLSILDSKPKNLLQIWNTRYLEKIDF